LFYEGEIYRRRASIGQRNDSAPFDSRPAGASFMPTAYDERGAAHVLMYMPGRRSSGPEHYGRLPRPSAIISSRKVHGTDG